MCDKCGVYVVGGILVCKCKLAGKPTGIIFDKKQYSPIGKKERNRKTYCDCKAGQVQKERDNIFAVLTREN